MTALRAAPSPRLRGILLAVVPLAALLITTQFLLPGDDGPGRGTPLAILAKGVILGLLAALSSVGIVVIYRTLRIVNFAQGAIGLAAGVFVMTCIAITDIPFPIAFLLGLLISAFLGLAVGLFTLRFFDSSRLFLTVVTIVGSEVFFQLIGFILRLPIFPPINERPVEQPTAETFRRLLPFGGFNFRIGDLPLDFGFAEVFSFEVAILTLLAIGAFFKFTKSGVAVRAVAENAERASLLGIGVAKLSVIVWVITGALAGVTVMLTSLLTGASGGGSREASFDILLPVLAAALIARMTSIPIAVWASVLIGVAQQAYAFSFRDEGPLFNVALFALLSVGLLVQRRQAGRSESGAAVSWSATDEPRPIPKELSGAGDRPLQPAGRDRPRRHRRRGLPVRRLDGPDRARRRHLHQRHRRPLPRRADRLGGPGQPRAVRLRGHRGRRRRRHSTSTRGYPVLARGAARRPPSPAPSPSSSACRRCGSRACSCW